MINTEEKKVSEILDLMKFIDSDSKELIKKSFDYAQKAHNGQMRASGEPYFNHVFETAKILAEIGMTPAIVATGLLHDVLEDTNTTREDLAKEFSEEIAFLVEGVTKLGKLKYRGLQRHTESLRKFFIATSKDIRVLIIRLADRLHNMRTLEHLPREKQIRKADEVLEIFAPLAYRLGMRLLHKELEDLAFKYKYPEEYEKTLSILKQRKKHDMKFLEKFDRSLRKALAKEKVINFKTSFRVKGLYSLYNKLKRKHDNIEKIYDITALRVITDSVSDCYKILGVIHSIWKPLPGRLKDYIALPKPNGYQSLHTTIFTGDGGIIEIQIRTQEMHRMSEMGVASHLLYKGDRTKDATSQIAWFKKIISKLDNSHKKEKEECLDEKEKENAPEWIKRLGKECAKEKESENLLEELRTDFFEERVFVFTPNGDVIDLPKGANPVDFAYAIHSDIGDHLTGAKINGKLASIDSHLANGDIVEIITKPSAKPTRKWLDIAKTSEAKRKIKASIKV